MNLCSSFSRDHCANLHFRHLRDSGRVVRSDHSVVAISAPFRRHPPSISFLNTEQLHFFQAYYYCFQSFSGMYLSERVKPRLLLGQEALVLRTNHLLRC